MKTFDPKSLLVGVVLTMSIVIVMLLATSSSAPVAWEYKVVSQVRMPFPYQDIINSAGNDRWEVVGVGIDSQGGAFAVMKRPKAVQRPAWWKFWKK